MTDIHSICPGLLAESPTENGGTPRFSFFQKLRSNRSRSRSYTSSSHETRHPISNASSTSRFAAVIASPVSGVRDALPDVLIAEEFEGLREAITFHAMQFYTSRNARYKSDDTTSKHNIEHATKGLPVPWHKLQGLLDDNLLRPGALILCIAWTVLSRSLLLKLGIGKSTGSTFLPPEIVESFQSFSIGAKEIDGATAEHDKSHANFALLSHWKQISATLMHATYVADAFSHFDSRTVNIERAINDLDPLLRCYAISDEATRNYARLTNLREVLRRGARFAFTLFGQPSFWKFDWTISPLRNGGRVSGGSVGSEETGGVSLLGHGLALDMAVWPTLVRVMDGEGRKVEGEVLGEKKRVCEFC